MTSNQPARPFIGSEALAAGRVTTHSLRSAHRRIFPDVYCRASGPIDPTTLVSAAALWAPSGSVVAGLAAARLHGERWYSPESVRREVDIYTLGPTHAPRGVRARRLRSALPGAQLHVCEGITVTSVARTAVDVARWEDDDERAIAKIDALCNRTQTDVSEVRSLASSLGGLHGLRRVRGLLRDADHRADSPRETRLRLILGGAELPVPIPQLIIYNEYGVKITVADFGYPEQRVAIFYDGEVHRRRSTWEHDARVNAELAELGWQVVRVTAQMLRNHATVIRQIQAALRRGQSAP
ncbi:DUF559 domain-containing protein [Dietzia sp. UBA5065]|uniref:DUF559 domain-containing protein n=1 Tax=Dietzia sp. UBA5065 TaxID=1946422 RepID=UPI0025BBA741|nr:DUF559 domain-containing protein [Dietzia sp. UBA5065]